MSGQAPNSVQNKTFVDFALLYHVGMLVLGVSKMWVHMGPRPLKMEVRLMPWKHVLPHMG